MVGGRGWWLSGLAGCLPGCGWKGALKSEVRLQPLSNVFVSHTVYLCGVCEHAHHRQTVSALGKSPQKKQTQTQTLQTVQFSFLFHTAPGAGVTMLLSRCSALAPRAPVRWLPPILIASASATQGCVPAAHLHAGTPAHQSKPAGQGKTAAKSGGSSGSSAAAAAPAKAGATKGKGGADTPATRAFAARAALLAGRTFAPTLPRHQVHHVPAPPPPPGAGPSWSPSSVRVGVLALKCGMTADFDVWGVRHPLTVLKVRG